MLITAVSIMEFDDLLDVLKESIQAYENNSTDSNKADLIFDAGALGMKSLIEKHGLEYVKEKLSYNEIFFQSAI